MAVLVERQTLGQTADSYPFDVQRCTGLHAIWAFEVDVHPKASCFGSCYRICSLIDGGAAKVSRSRR